MSRKDHRFTESPVLQLALQGLELRLHQARFEFCAVERPALRLVPVLEGVGQANEEEVGHEDPVELCQVLDPRREPPAPHTVRGGRGSGANSGPQATGVRGEDEEVDS